MHENCDKCPEGPFEGKLSQNFDIGLSFCFIACRRGDFLKRYKRS